MKKLIIFLMSLLGLSGFTFADSLNFYDIFDDIGNIGSYCNGSTSFYLKFNTDIHSQRFSFGKFIFGAHSFNLYNVSLGSPIGQFGDSHSQIYFNSGDVLHFTSNCKSDNNGNVLLRNFYGISVFSGGNPNDYHLLWLDSYGLSYPYDYPVFGIPSSYDSGFANDNNDFILNHKLNLCNDLFDCSTNSNPSGSNAYKLSYTLDGLYTENWSNYDGNLDFTKIDKTTDDQKRKYNIDLNNLYVLKSENADLGYPKILETLLNDSDESIRTATQNTINRKDDKSLDLSIPYNPDNPIIIK